MFGEAYDGPLTEQERDALLTMIEKKEISWTPKEWYNDNKP